MAFSGGGYESSVGVVADILSANAHRRQMTQRALALASVYGYCLDNNLSESGKLSSSESGAAPFDEVLKIAVAERDAQAQRVERDRREATRMKSGAHGRSARRHVSAAAERVDPDLANEGDKNVPFATSAGGGRQRTVPA